MKRLERKHIKVLTGKAFMYSNISLKLLGSCFGPAGASTGFYSRKLKRISRDLKMYHAIK